MTTNDKSKKSFLERMGIVCKNTDDKPIRLSVEDAERIYLLASSYFRKEGAIVTDDISDRALYALEQELNKAKGW